MVGAAGPIRGGASVVAMVSIGLPTKGVGAKGDFEGLIGAAVATRANFNPKSMSKDALELLKLEDGVRLTRRNEAGENIPLDDRMRAEEIRNTRAVIAVDCK